MPPPPVARIYVSEEGSATPSRNKGPCNNTVSVAVESRIIPGERPKSVIGDGNSGIGVELSLLLRRSRRDCGLRNEVMRVK